MKPKARLNRLNRTIKTDDRAKRLEESKRRARKRVDVEKADNPDKPMRK